MRPRVIFLLEAGHARSLDVTDFEAFSYVPQNLPVPHAFVGYFLSRRRVKNSKTRSNSQTLGPPLGWFGNYVTDHVMAGITVLYKIE